MAKCAILVIIPRVTGSEACNCNYKPQSQAIRTVGTLAGTSIACNIAAKSGLNPWYKRYWVSHLTPTSVILGDSLSFGKSFQLFFLVLLCSLLFSSSLITLVRNTECSLLSQSSRKLSCMNQALQLLKQYFSHWLVFHQCAIMSATIAVNWCLLNR